jgi:hypothetical protein
MTLLLDHPRHLREKARMPQPVAEDEARTKRSRAIGVLGVEAFSLTVVSPKKAKRTLKTQINIRWQSRREN